MNTQAFDRRLTPARADRAAAHLRGRVEAATFVEGEARTVVAPVAPLRREPRLDCGLDTEALRGEAVALYEEHEGWAWVQLGRDGYVGYMAAEALGPAETATHVVRALRTFVYPAPNLKVPVQSALSLGSRLTVRRVVDGYAAVADGFVWAGHLLAVDAAPEIDFVAVAERFLGVPYLWGGKSSLGLDCSGLVQIALDAAGHAAPRDSDMQQRVLGAAISPEGPLRRGDLVFWKGHVGIMRDDATLLHANAHTMMVSSEPLAEARSRIQASTGLDVSAVKRL